VLIIAFCCRYMMSSPIGLVTRFLDLFSDWNESIMKQRLTTETILCIQALLVGKPNYFWISHGWNSWISLCLKLSVIFLQWFDTVSREGIRPVKSGYNSSELTWSTSTSDQHHMVYCCCHVPGWLSASGASLPVDHWHETGYLFHSVYLIWHYQLLNVN